MKGEYAMIVKKIKYKDFRGVDREDEFYFNMSKAEVIKWLTTNGNYTIDKVIEKLIKTENARDLVGEFDYLITESIGEVSLDGIRFIKNEEIKTKFTQSNAYSELFMELVSDAKKAAEFFNGILPDDLSSAIQNAITENPDALPDVLKDYVGTNDEKAEVVKMPTQQ